MMTHKRTAWWLYFVALGLALLWGWREFPGYVAATEYQQDDWEWLVHGSSLESFLRHVLQPTEIIRPVFHALYAVAYPLSGLDARPLAFALALAWCVTSAASIWMLYLARLPLGVALLGVAVSRPTPPVLDAFAQVSYQGLTLSRFLVVATCIAFLRGEPRTFLWVCLVLAGLLTHEQYFVALPMLLALLAWRDGVSSVWAGLTGPSALRAFASCFTVLAVTRVLIFCLEGAGGTHAPGFGRTLTHFRWLVGSLPPFCSPLLMLVVVLASIATPVSRLRRSMVLGAALVVIGYAPFVFQRAYFAPYFGNIAVLGTGLLIAFWIALAVEVDSASDSRWRKIRSFAVLALLLVWMAMPPRLPDRVAPGFARQMIEVSTEMLEEEPVGREIKVVFLDPTEHSRPGESPPYYRAIGLEHGRSRLHELLWPETSFRFERRSEPLADDPEECEMRLLVERTKSDETPWRVHLADPFECPAAAA